MQVFEVIELEEFPFMETREVGQGQIVVDIINENRPEKVYLLVDHDTKRIWKYNGANSSLKLQNYGEILAGMLRRQLRLFYGVYSLNEYSKDDPESQELLKKPITGGRAKPIKKRDFPNQKLKHMMKPHLSLDIKESKKIIDDFVKKNIEQILESVKNKIQSIMKKESVNELTIARQYLPEIFNADLLEISNDDGLPILKPFVTEYLNKNGITTELYGNIMKFKKQGKKK